MNGQEVKRDASVIFLAGTEVRLVPEEYLQKGCPARMNGIQRTLKSEMAMRESKMLEIVLEPEFDLGNNGKMPREQVQEEDSGRHTFRLLIV